MLTTPKCTVFGECGGCLHQDKSYEFQLETKKREVMEALVREGLKAPEDIKMFFKDEYGYRNRMDFVFSAQGPGFRRRGKFDKMVAVNDCPISNTGINNGLKQVWDWFGKYRDEIDVYEPVRRTGTLRYATTRSSFFSGDQSVTFILNSNSEKKEAHIELAKKFAQESTVPNVLAGFVKYNTDQSISDEYTVLKGSDILNETLAGIKYYYHTQGFFQNNSSVMLDMMHYVKANAGAGYDTVTDLFGGVGTFGIFLAGAAKELIIIDNSISGIKCALQNMVENRITNGEAYAVDAMDLNAFLPRYTAKRNLFILDPPRAGLHKKTVKFINAVLPEKMIYVSCNPQQLSLDLKKLSENYTVKEIAVFDMFPQTRHIESIAVMERKNTSKTDVQG
jgi:23S rRNA (uracil1939-C5)-methyltransferase